MIQVATPTQLPAGAGDFDFLHGRWVITNQRLRERLAGCTDWEHFAATGECRPVLGGLGNVDSFDADWRGAAFRGFTLRLFDPASARWSIYWADNQRGVLEPPVRGGFVEGIGEFFGADHHRGTPVLARFRWMPGTREARWEQAFSTDQGLSWETNWVMDFQRLDD
jgi:hypothetical protein